MAALANSPRLELVIPVPDQRRSPFRIETPDGPTDALALKILDDRRAVGGVAFGSFVGFGGRRLAFVDGGLANPPNSVAIIGYLAAAKPKSSSHLGSHGCGRLLE